MARVRINKMTVAELAAFCTVQRQGGSCPKDCALRKLECGKFLPALWDIEAVRRDEQREDAIDMVRHLIAAHGIYPEEAFPGLPEVEPPKDKRVPNRLKDVIGEEPKNDGSGGAVTTSPEEDEAADKSSAPVLTVGLAESECVWADETANEADKPTEQADRRAESMRQAEEILNAGKGKPSAPVRAVDVAKGNIAQAEFISALDGFKPIAECKPVEPPKRRGRPPRKASE